MQDRHHLNSFSFICKACYAAYLAKYKSDLEVCWTSELAILGRYIFTLISLWFWGFINKYGSLPKRHICGIRKKRKASKPGFADGQWSFHEQITHPLTKKNVKLMVDLRKHRKREREKKREIHREIHEGKKSVLWRPHYPGKNEQQVWTLLHMARGQEVKCFPSVL